MLDNLIWFMKNVHVKVAVKSKKTRIQIFTCKCEYIFIIFICLMSIMLYAELSIFNLILI